MLRNGNGEFCVFSNLKCYDLVFLKATTLPIKWNWLVSLIFMKGIIGNRLNYIPAVNSILSASLQCNITIYGMIWSLPSKNVYAYTLKAM